MLELNKEALMIVFRHPLPILAGALLLGACSRVPTACDPAVLEQHGAELSARAQGDPAQWHGTADSILASAPADSVLHIVVFLHPQAKRAFVDWAVSTGGGYGYGPRTVPFDSSNPPIPGPDENRRGGTGQPENVPGVMIRYEFSSFSAFSLYMPVWALEELKEQDITGVDFGLGTDHEMLC